MPCRFDWGRALAWGGMLAGCLGAWYLAVTRLLGPIARAVTP